MDSLQRRGPSDLGGHIGPIVAYRSRGRLAVLLIDSLFFIVLSVLLLARYSTSTNPNRRSQSLQVSRFFGVCGLFALSRMLRRMPAIILDDEGLTDNTSVASVGFIPCIYLHVSEQSRSIATHECGL
ncbi:STM3941 family protein [Burkholderia pseudomultivorans]|uniref:STM3941 family protein n=1 Tax=Burkholderia pseudomultivorans TaxID=1207504 RepID=UPI0038F5EDCD